MNIDFSIIGARIKAARKDKKITQEELAESLSVTVGYVSQVERGQTKVSLDTLSRIADALECDMANFITGVANTHPSYLSAELQKKFEIMDSDTKKLLVDIADTLIKNSDKKNK